MISIHAPTRGATPERAGQALNINYFNPRSHEGSDMIGQALKEGDADISIHAPTRGATNQTTDTQSIDSISIHAPTRGATSAVGSYRCKLEYFNPRSHEGSDAIRCVTSFIVSRFQSTLPRGERRVLRVCQQIFATISIHAPTRGAT